MNLRLGILQKRKEMKEKSRKRGKIYNEIWGKRAGKVKSNQKEVEKRGKYKLLFGKKYKNCEKSVQKFVKNVHN